MGWGRAKRLSRGSAGVGGSSPSLLPASTTTLEQNWAEAKSSSRRKLHPKNASPAQQCRSISASALSARPRTPTPPALTERACAACRDVHGVSRCTVCQQCVEAARRPSCACSRARVLQMTRCHGRRGAGNAAMAEAAAMAQAAAVARRMKTMAQAFAQGPLVTLAAARRGSADGRTLLKSGISTPNRASREPKERCLTRPATPAAPSAWPSAAPGATPPGATPGATPGVPPAMPPAQHEIHECA